VALILGEPGGDAGDLVRQCWPRTSQKVEPLPRVPRLGAASWRGRARRAAGRLAEKIVKGTSVNGDRPLPCHSLNQGRWPTANTADLPLCQAKPPLTKATADHAVIQSMAVRGVRMPERLGWHLRIHLSLSLVPMSPAALL